jgi:hypothetical protein
MVFNFVALKFAGIPDHHILTDYVLTMHLKTYRHRYIHHHCNQCHMYKCEILLCYCTLHWCDMVRLVDIRYRLEKGRLDEHVVQLILNKLKII